MKLIAWLIVVFVSATAGADELNVRNLLKRDLSDQITFISENEIHYCPDNTCEIYKSNIGGELLATYVYLHIIHLSTYTPIYRKPFINSAKEKEVILNSMNKFCAQGNKTPKCTISGLGAHLNIINCFGRYDEGHFCYSCKPNENICEKL